MCKKLGILGGMGPLATADLFKKVILLTDANCDQEHIHILIDNNTSIPDRTAHLIAEGDDPREQLIASAKRLESMGADFLIMPCNTAHNFYEAIIKEIEIPFLNMIEETSKFIAEKYAGKKIGLLATEGTCQTGVYDRAIQKYGMELVKPTKTQKNVTDFIYDIKAGKDITIDGFNESVEELKNLGAEVFILGCTELSVGYEMFKMKGNYVDPLEVIALRAIHFAGKKSLKSL
ncbi:aspartate/glutamate racemase family protein [Crassaminicella profunda]|uniref:aspartate/glutamate racemase family protein n=1 Tax=Crassaminicella profunda TaxID=1286698 RepID=UPI001CA7AC80|nr:amino acid racemase [Crassaminicella profunda]QZY56337.1 amino acid racemase [Crassaminicella profunda]